MVKSNIFSIFVFLVGVGSAYLISFHLNDNEKEIQLRNIKIESQAISHNIQHELKSDANQVQLVISRWNSIDDINQNWQTETNGLKKLNPYIDGIKLFPLMNKKSLTLNQIDLIQYEESIDKKRYYRNHAHLPLKVNLIKQNAIYSSFSFGKEGRSQVFNLQIPIIINKQLFAYVETSININKLLQHKIDSFQIVHPFSISENGITLFTYLPQQTHINDVTGKYDLLIYGGKWQLMVWSKAPLSKNNAFLILAIFSSLILAICAKLILMLFIMRKKSLQTKQYLQQINADCEHSQAKLIQVNKLTALGEIATGIAHEINQPLQVITIHADLCQENLTDQNYHLVEKSFREIVNQVDRIEKIVKQVGSFARDSEFDSYKKEKPIEILNDVMTIIVNQYQQERVELRQVIPPSLPSLYCNRIQIEQVLVNLLINAKDSVETSQKKIVFIKAHEQSGSLYIQISDTGTGIDETKMNDIFSPFYTTKALGKGTGLGLSISDSIVHQHKGEIKVSSKVGLGSVFTVRLPLEN